VTERLKMSTAIKTPETSTAIQRSTNMGITVKAPAITATARKTAMRIKLKALPHEQLITFTDRELKQYRRNSEGYGRLDEARKAASMMYARGIARADDLRVFPWNPDSVHKTIQRFMKVALTVKDSQRKPYVEAGGFKRRAKSDPTKLWIDAYCAVKTPTVNSSFACHVKAPGDEPTFVLELKGTQCAVYRVDQLDEAFQDWCRLVSEAIIGLTDSHSSVQAVEAQLAAAA
jgi:hypothetical protein